jgi:hypothetical protein
MDQYISRLTGNWFMRQSGPALVVIGLASLIAAAWWPAAPVLSAMGLISLGATEITLRRNCGTAFFPHAAILHAVTYAGLYGLFVGAVFDAAMRSSTPGTTYWASVDFAVSVMPIAMAAKRTFAALRQSASSNQ